MNPATQRLWRQIRSGPCNEGGKYVLASGEKAAADALVRLGWLQHHNGVSDRPTYFLTQAGAIAARNA